MYICVPECVDGLSTHASASRVRKGHQIFGTKAKFTTLLLAIEPFSQY